MAAKQEMVEDYALRYVPTSFRKPWYSIFNSANGATTALVGLTYAGGLAMTYGTVDALIVLSLAVIAIGIVGYYLASRAAESGLDCDLMTRGSGYGFLGSAVTSLLYSANYLLFFAFEGDIMAAPIHYYFSGIPMYLIYLVIGLVFVPLTWYGVTLINRLEWILTPLYMVGLVLLLGSAIPHLSNLSWLTFVPRHPVNPTAGPPLLQGAATIFGGLTLATQSGDLARFVDAKQRTLAGWTLGPITAFLGNFVFATLGIYIAFAFGNTNPGLTIVKSLGFIGLLMVMITQTRVNILNGYFGSLAFSNFFARVLKFAPGRQWWVVLTVGLSTILMELNVLAHIQTVFVVLGMFMVSWIATIVSDMSINRALGLRPHEFEYKRSHLYALNPVGIISLILAMGTGLLLVFGVAGPMGFTVAPFVALTIGVVAPVALAALTRGKYYISPARDHFEASLGTDSFVECATCATQYEVRDSVYCPYHEAPLCSVCCATDKSCGEVCKTQSQSALVAFESSVEVEK
ncbi:MAG: hypothetical protein M1294_11945 [Firmicutes bacterium]|jgi:purine-cytosine permease-like protein|uniref:Allantoin permease n=1 Tax=Sulfobacillus benefaciens TaxID=453960 RepID=A0A2T2WXQ0_9FIRM|nr:hypothetical protein [Bacillota bacterium]MCL5013547.1 hypothetical protein [Bacillota bacterium]PSR27010.1 MAG: hypothetical protein C7B43_12640 [Sulfobacillus benefaciens]